MEDSKLAIIAELMEELQGKMDLDADDLESRLGRKKPGVEVTKIEGKLPMGDEELEQAEEMTGEDLDHDMEMGEDPEHAAMVLDESTSPEEKLKQRLMKLRG